MKKLTLHLDDLRVESFHTDAHGCGPRGTVQGLEHPSPDDEDPCAETCAGSRAETRDGTCVGDYTCGDWSCGPYCQSAGGYARYGCQVIVY